MVVRLEYTIDVGGVSKTAGYVSGSGGTSLVFAYEVQAGDLDDAGGITSDTSALDANSGTLKDADGHDLDLTTIAVSAGANTVGVDAASPTVTGVVISGAQSDGSTPNAGTLVAGDKILVTVTVDENITVDTSGGTPQYTIDVGGVSKTAAYVSGSGGTSLVFAYEVQAGDLDDAGGITSDTSALDANSGTLKDADGHDLDLTTIAVSAGANTVGVDAASPTVTGVVISGAQSDGSTPNAGTLVAGDKILVTVTVDENITVDTSGGTPQYTIDVGGVSKTAAYVSGSGGTSLVFAYEVQAGDLDDAGGITSDTSALDANSGTLKDADGHDLDLTTIAVSAGANTVGVDAASPTVTGVVISGAQSDGSTPNAGTLVAGDKILVTVTVDENITVDTSGGTPQYTIDVGGVSKTAAYVSGSGGTSLVFAYEVQAGDLDDAGGITSDTSALDANSGTLKDADGHDLDLTTIAVSAGANTVGVDAASPTVTGVVISGAQSDGSTPNAGTLVAGDKILVTVTVDENITVDTSGGTPQYTIDVGGVSKTAAYVSGSGGTSLVFAYEVQAGDLDDAGGITSDTSALDANSGTLKDADGHDLDLTTIAVSAGANTVGVDAASPTVTGVVISGAQSDGSTPNAGTLVAGDKILVTVTVDENITVDTSGGTPQYTIDVGGVSKTAAYVSGSGGTSLVFAYEVQAGDLDDAGGITSDTSALDANSGTLKDADGHDLDLTTIAVSAGANTVGVDAASPTVTGVVISGAQSDGSTPKAGTLVAGDKILVKVAASEMITVTGTPEYTIDVGGVSKTATYVSGSGALLDPLIFAYEVQAGDADAVGGIEAGTGALALAGGTLQDSDGNDLDLTTVAVSAGANTVGVDAASPTVTGVVISGAQSDGSTPKAGTLVAGDKILVTVTVDENITVDTSGGTPQYTIDVGGVSKTAAYVSGSGGTSLVFAYEVQAGDLDDAGGITSDTSALDANSGTLKDADGHDLDLTTIAVSAGANTVGVDAASPTVTGVVISGAQSDGSTPNAGTLVAGDKILVTVTVDENITVDTSGGTPQYTIDVGGVSKTAAYVSGSGGTSLVFAYEVQAGDLDDAGGITSDTSALDANSGTLKDADGHDLDLTTIAVSAGANTVGVDAASPTVTGVVISGAQSDGSTPNAGTLVAGDKILVTVTVDENITVDTSGGTPQYTIDVGGVSKTAAYVSGSGGTSLVFAYEVQAGDLDDAGGITSDTSALDANSGTLKDADGHDLDLTTIAVSAGANTVGVDAASPTVTGVVISGAQSDGSTPKAGTLVAGDKILVKVAASEMITVTGTPEYTIDVGGVSKTATYVSGSGALLDPLIFAYEVQAGDADAVGGIEAGTGALALAGGTLQDSDGNDLDLTTVAVSAGANTVGVDAAAPTVSINSLEIFSGSTGSHSYSPIMHGLGDLNEDGFDDFALAPFRSTDPGKFHIVFGRANSGSLEDRIDIDVGHTHKATITNDLGSTGFGASIAFAASLTSQGSQDILVYQEGGDISQFGTYPSTAFILPYTEIEGALVNGDAALSTIGRVNITDLQGGINLGVVTGDFNGDGQSDLHLGSQKAVAGGRSHFIEAAGQFNLGETVSVYDLTSANGFNNEGGESSGDLTAAFFQGDIDADGFDELVVHGLNHDPNGHLSGQVYLVWGTDNYQTGTTYGLHNTTDARWTIIDGPQIRSLIQVMSTHSGDVIGDDKPDLVISARNIDRNFRDIFVLDGSYLATRPAHVDLASFTEAMGVQVTNVGLGQTNAEILTDLTSDLDGDGKAEIGFGSAELTGVNGQAGIIYSSGLANAGASFDLAANLNQVTLIDDSNATSRFGLSFRSIGDIDGDAEDDYAIGFTDETLALEGVQIVSGNDLKVPGSNLVVQNLNSRPFFSSISATIEFAENGSGTVYTPAATDPDSNALTYTINSGADADKFELVGGALTFKQAPDFENPTDASTPPDNVYEVQIQADDGNGGTATQSVSVTVTDVVGGFVINGIDAGDNSGFSVSSCG